MKDNSDNIDKNSADNNVMFAKHIIMIIITIDAYILKRLRRLKS